MVAILENWQHWFPFIQTCVEQSILSRSLKIDIFSGFKWKKSSVARVLRARRKRKCGAGGRRSGLQASRIDSSLQGSGEVGTGERAQPWKCGPRWTLPMTSPSFHPSSTSGPARPAGTRGVKVSAAKRGVASSPVRAFCMPAPRLKWIGWLADTDAGL